MSMTEAMQMSGGFEEFMGKTSWGAGRGGEVDGSSSAVRTIKVSCLHSLL